MRFSILLNIQANFPRNIIYMERKEVDWQCYCKGIRATTCEQPASGIILVINLWAFAFRTVNVDMVRKMVNAAPGFTIKFIFIHSFISFTWF